ncbi:sensor histidine kinase VraS [Gracilibacillus boraciitolerans JCM 21714]|uniref:Sensor histidine kinase n=1 Tax=Gracilibacillus boraciitolerans JCM 21714 TaxID=1298598 RepID=W4VP56_9BACI|nr:sensor histidine kinase [Gracilibacillus boraciitolerans]GAE94529.1 sensor histidine kinase VraS [Gracilibacillus boraciitolerans JCM 21714]
MKLYTRIISSSILFSFLLFIILSIFFYLAFPINDFRLLWTVKVLEVPFVIMLPTVTLLFGCIIGLVMATFWQNCMKFLEKNINRLLNNQSFTDPIAYEEMKIVLSRLKEVQQYIQDQTKRAQKLIEERANAHEETINQVISEERNRLARELHDSVSQELFAASMLVSAVLATDTQTNSKQLYQIEAMIQQAQLEMRALLLHLRPILLKDNSLKEGMEQLLEELHTKVPMKITWRIEEVIINKGIEDQLFRILQESISNALRHAKAENIDVLLIKRDEFLILKIADDGIGFNLEEKRNNSYGLTNMYERAAEVGGHLKVVSIPTEGTKIEVRVPLISEGGN